MKQGKPQKIAVNIRHDEIPSWNFLPRHQEQLEAGLPGCQVRVCGDDEEFREALKESDTCMTWYFQQDWLAQAPHLWLLSTPAAGRDYFHIVPPPGLTLMYGQFHGELIGETVVGMILSLARGILPAVTTYSKEAWPRQQLAGLMRPLRGSHVVILGLGHIGCWIGRLLKPFGVRISGLRRNLAKPAPDWFDENDRVFGVENLEENLSTADFVVLSLPGTRETDHLLNGHCINQLKPSAYVINVGRGNAIEQMSFYSALSAGRIAGAFLDVFPEEPLTSQSMLLKCPNLWRMPHASAISGNYLDLYAKDFLRQLAKLSSAD